MHACRSTLEDPTDTLINIAELTGSAYDDVLHGNGGDNDLFGREGNDAIFGGAGDDFLLGHQGDDLVDGGEGDDTIWMVTLGGAAPDATLDLAITTAQNTGHGLDVVLSIENIYGGEGNDLFYGNDAVNEMAGSAGDDELHGRGGADDLSGTWGDDLIFGDAGNDFLEGGDDADILYGGVGDDTIAGSGYYFWPFDPPGDDVLYGGDGNDLLIGGEGVDLLYGGAGVDTARVLAAVPVNVSLALSGAQAVGTGFVTLDGFENLEGGETDDVLTGDAAANIIDGGRGSDVLDGGGGADTLRGGEGNDVYLLRGGEIVFEAANEGEDTIRTSQSHILIVSQNIENIELQGSDDLRAYGHTLDNVLTGNSGNNVLFGAGGWDTLYGGGGADVLVGGQGDDRLYGGSGLNEMIGGLDSDTYFVESHGDTVYEEAVWGIDEVRTALTSYRLSANVENLAYTGAATFVGIGQGLDNIIVGGAGRDELFGMDGADTLNDGGGAAADTLIGGLGDDVYLVSNVGASTIEYANQGTDQVRTTIGIYALQANVENLTFTDNADHRAGVGNDLRNQISGGTGIDDLFGRAGDDYLDGGAGSANSMFGQEGDDTFVVRAAGDSVVEFAGQGADTVLALLSSHVLAANVENLTFAGSGDFVGIGNGEANTINGGSGVDFLSGLAGADVLIGGGAADQLLGGDGIDQFRVGTGQGGPDRLLDFVSGTDKIGLQSSAFTPSPNIDFIQGTTVVSGNSSLLYQASTGYLYYDDDGTGAGAAVLLCQLNIGQTLVAGDIIWF